MTKGRIEGRDRFCERVATSLGRERLFTVAKPVWSRAPQDNVLSQCTQEELVEVLKAHCGTIHTDVYETTSESLASTLTKLVNTYGGGPLVYWRDKRFSEYGLTTLLEEEFPKQSVVTTCWDNRNRERSITACEQANIGITFSDSTLAESGTVVLYSGEGKGRSVSLLPTNYIAIIPQSTIVPRMTQSARALREYSKTNGGAPSCVNWISGPSNSADIELSLVVGVHGPIAASYVIVKDA
ncbi:LutC/YkgG family protein [Aureibacillus halotolerans]|uniref:Lactate utilization protein C n=1 Tax=Aureibacillus halotolerans TaxID=1508390 RepID=A0A4R6U8V8_9BACI|nr:lactate utilization protein C [Aureibacillus halotolerans]TDQ42182.1 L-lactate dehydrogenase complex protein LldG [Aureibacillus halotolerans]